MMANPRDVLDRWMFTINAGDVDSLLGFYDRNAVLIPTFSNRTLNTPELRRQYFEALGRRQALSITLHEKTLLVQELHGRLFTLSGIYTWRFAIDGEPFSFEARFSYLLDLSRCGPILHHHSSQIPRTL